MLTDGVFCPIPWTGFMYNFDGNVKNCIRSSHQMETIGNLKDNTIEEILHGNRNLSVQQSILESKKVPSCHTCYDLECGKTGFDIVSDRIFYIRELRKQPLNTYQLDNFDLKTIDIRWSNTCNFACTYCSPEFSSKWSKELGVQHATPSEKQLEDLKQYVFKHAAQLEHVYMAGGEPLLMKQNLELLDLLKKVNPNVHLRVNTNLSKTNTQVFERICEFENVHWTVSGETMGEQFEYVRYGGKWQDWLNNLDTITALDHKVSFNMLYYILNYNSLFETVDFLLERGYHPNSFIIGPLLKPDYLDIRHLPNDVIDKISKDLSQRVEQKPGFLLEDSYRNLLSYVQKPFDADLSKAIDYLQTIDQRRNINSQDVFPEVYELL
jgi:radical SAM protein with 4Fe4S-binding SPASM domain